MITSEEIKQELDNITGAINLDENENKLTYDCIVALENLFDLALDGEGELIEALGFKLRGRRVWVTEKAYLLVTKIN